MRALTLALLIAAPATAETLQHGNLIFDVPAGWSSYGAGSDGLLTLRSDLPDEECEYCVIYISPGAQAQGQVDQWIRNQTRRFVDADDTTPPTLATMTESGIVNLAGRAAAMLGQKVDDDLQILYAVQLFGRMELIGFEAPAGDEAKLAEAMKVFERDIVPLMEGLLFVSEGADPLMPPPEPGPLQGLYWGYSTSWMMGLDGMMSMQMDHHFLAFWPDGTFYRGTPPQGLAPFDPASALAMGDMSWGSYRVDGDRLVLAFADGRVEDLAESGEGFQWGEAQMFPVEPLADGTVIDGSLYSSFYSGFTPGSGLEGGVSASNYTLFKPDGTWTHEASGGASAGFVDGAGTTTGGFTTGSENTRAGRYEVKDGLILRMPQDGSEPERDLIFKVGDDIMIGSMTLATGAEK